MVVKLPDLFKPKWRHSSARVRLAALSKISNPLTLYHIATSTQDERLCLEAAHRLNDPTLLARLARKAVHAEIRFEAALLIQDEATLAATALEAWHIEQGEIAVIHIENALLLRRVARSANQETVRLAAALKLNDPKLLKQVAYSVEDLEIRWQVAQKLEDPILMAEVASSKKNGKRVANLQQKALHAYLNYIEHCRSHMNIDALCAIIHTVRHVPCKIEAFLKLPPDRISAQILTHLSHQDFQSTSDEAVAGFLLKIKKSGWAVEQTIQTEACRQCHGAGKFSLHSMASENATMAHDLSICSKCSGSGQQGIRVITIQHPQHPETVFRIPMNNPDTFRVVQK